MHPLPQRVSTTRRGRLELSQLIKSAFCGTNLTPGGVKIYLKETQSRCELCHLAVWCVLSPLSKRCVSFTKQIDLQWVGARKSFLGNWNTVRPYLSMPQIPSQQKGSLDKSLLILTPPHSHLTPVCRAVQALLHISTKPRRLCGLLKNPKSKLFFFHV